MESASSCRVIYIDDRFGAEEWLSRKGPSSPTSPKKSQRLPIDLQTNVDAILSVFNQVYVCNAGTSFSAKLSEIHDSVKSECTPIIALFDVSAKRRHDRLSRQVTRASTFSDSAPPTPLLRRQMTFSSESDESYGLQLMSRIASDLQVDEGVKLIIPVAVVQPKQRKDSDSPPSTFGYGRDPTALGGFYHADSPLSVPEDESVTIDSQMMLQCLDAGALDVMASPVDKGTIMGLTVHAYRIYKAAKKEQGAFLAGARRGRKQSWVGVEEEKPYAYLREAMVKKLLKGICEPENVIEDYQHRDLDIEQSRKEMVASEIGKWSFDAHEFSEDELVYAGCCMLNHALQLPELGKWRMSEAQILHFMQGCRIAYNSFVLYHNFRHATDVLQSLFYFVVQIGALPPYPNGSTPPPLSKEKSPIAQLLKPFEALTLLISAIGHDVGHPGVNNMFLVKLNAPLAQLYNDQSVLEAFHCAAYSQILRRLWPAAFDDKGLRKLLISSILATDMGIHSDYMSQLGNLQEKIHECKVTDGWAPKDIDHFRVLTCGLLIKCADISNVARPWLVAERWTHLLQEEFAHQGEIENAVGMETTLFGGPPELGNVLKLANGQIGFMTIFAHPLFQNVADIIPAMGFAADEILKNKAVWFSRAEQEKRRDMLKRETGVGEGSISPRSQSPVTPNRKPYHGHEEKQHDGYFPSSPLRSSTTPSQLRDSRPPSHGHEAQPAMGTVPSPNQAQRSSLAGAQNVIREKPGAMSDFDTAGAFPSVPSEKSVSPSTTCPPMSASHNLGPNTRSQFDMGQRGGKHSASADESTTGTSISLRSSSENEDPRRPKQATVIPAVLDRGVAGAYIGVSDASSDLEEKTLKSEQDVSAAEKQSQTQDFLAQDARTKNYARFSGFNFGLKSDTEAENASYPPPPHHQARSSDKFSVPSITTTTTTNPGTGAKLSPGTESTSLLSTNEANDESSKEQDEAEQMATGMSDFEGGGGMVDHGSRAVSAPMHMHQQSSPRAAVGGMDGPTATSRGSSKNDVRTTEMGVANGDVRSGDSTGRSRFAKASIGNMPRRRSKLRLAFWKKRSHDEEATK